MLSVQQPVVVLEAVALTAAIVGGLTAYSFYATRTGKDFRCAAVGQNSHCRCAHVPQSECVKFGLLSPAPGCFAAMLLFSTSPIGAPFYDTRAEVC